LQRLLTPNGLNKNKLATGRMKEATT
jgi:osmoprotectant transport system permease protein